MTAEPFKPSASMLEVRTSGPVVPLLRMPDGQVAAGFLTADVEVNQVFGSLTEPGQGDRWLVEVPGGQEGPYTLVLTGTGTGPFTANVSTRFTGESVYGREIKGVAKPGQRVFTRISHDVNSRDPRTARVLQGRVDELQPWLGGEPAKVVAVPRAASPSRTN